MELATTNFASIDGLVGKICIQTTPTALESPGARYYVGAKMRVWESPNITGEDYVDYVRRNNNTESRQKETTETIQAKGANWLVPFRANMLVWGCTVVKRQVEVGKR